MRLTEKDLNKGSPKNCGSWPRHVPHDPFRKHYKDEGPAPGADVDRLRALQLPAHVLALIGAGRMGYWDMIVCGKGLTATCCNRQSNRVVPNWLLWHLLPIAAHKKRMQKNKNRSQNRFSDPCCIWLSIKKATNQLQSNYRLYSIRETDTQS